jgi:SAM-dependent methyltransferase
MSDEEYSEEEESDHSDDGDDSGRKRRELGKYLLKAQELFDKLYSECPEQMGKQLSRNERERKDLTDSNLVFGEAIYEPLAHIFKDLVDKGLLGDRGNFYDLGSGTGKAAFTALLMHDWHKCVGIEYLEQLVTMSQDIVKRWKMACKEEDTFLPHEKQYCDIRFVNGDLLDTNWKDATCLFITATCFDEKLMAAIDEKTRDVEPGTICLCLTKKLKSDRWETIQTHEKLAMSWGKVKLYVQRRVQTAEEAEGAEADAANNKKREARKAKSKAAKGR